MSFAICSFSIILAEGVFLVCPKAVCYLNSYGKDFEGGLFHFQDGEPKTIAPMVGVSASVQYFLIICLLLLEW